MFIYCICTQYLVGAPFALITASIWRGMEVISLWHCWGGVEAQVSLTVAFSSSAFFGLLFLIFLLTIHHRFSTGFRSDDLMSLHHRTLFSKWNTKLALIWKEDFGPLGNSPVLLLLSPGKTALSTTVAKFLDTSVCSDTWCLDPSLSPFLVKFTQILESILLNNPHKGAVLSVGCAYFSSTLFPSTQLSVNMLGYNTLWTASFFGNECLWLTLLVKGVNDCLLDNCQISSLPHDCVA